MNKKLFSIFLILIIGVGIGSFLNLDFLNNRATADDLRLDDQEATIRAISSAMPKVVSILVYEEKDYTEIDLSTGEQNKKQEKVKVGEGTGFIISPDGLILTNKHVVDASTKRIAQLKVVLDNGSQYDANLIDKDPIHDLAVLQIGGNDFPYMELGNSDELQPGATVVAIGNSMGVYQNSATKGIVSGLGRALTASDNNGTTENFDNLIQTDAEINLGNSGGPLIDLYGRVVGVNVAVDKSGTAIGFAIPINDVRPAIQSVRERQEIIRPQLGVRYIMITPELVGEENLARTTGAWIVADQDNGPTVLPNSPASVAGLEPGDIIFEVNAIEIQGKNNLFSVIQRYKPGDRIGMKIQRGNKIMIKILTLGEFK